MQLAFCASFAPGKRLAAAIVNGSTPFLKDAAQSALMPYHEPMTSAEQAYLFRHALLRDAAYELQLPADRARLHGLAFHLLEVVFGGRAPELKIGERFEPHGTDAIAVELAQHLALAGEHEYQPVLRLYLHRSAEHAERHYLHELAVRQWDALASIESGPAKLEFMRRAATWLWQTGRVAEAEKRLDSVLADSGAASPRTAATALANYATLMQQTGRIESAETNYLAALAALRVLGDRRGESNMLDHLATLYHETGRMAEAETCFGQAIALCADDDSYAGNVLANLARLQIDLGRFDAAQTAYEKALAIFRKHPSERAEGRVYLNLAALHQRRGRHELVADWLERALAVLLKIGDRRAHAVALQNLAVLYQETGRFEPAGKLHEQALAVLREVGDRRGVGVVLMNLALVVDEAGQPAAALAYSDEALLHLRATGDRFCEGIAIGNRASFCCRLGQFQQARAEYGQAITIHRQTGNRRFEGMHRCGLAHCLLYLRQVEAAASEWAEGARLLTEAADFTELARQRELMRKTCAAEGLPPLE
jgi:tetratricopeptide (TPR) repeat protein